MMSEVVVTMNFKRFWVRSPEGEYHENPNTSLQQFCLSRGWKKRVLSSVASGRKQSHLGWTAGYLEKRARCVHGRQQNYCVDCNGSQICIHSKQRFNCRFCKTKKTKFTFDIDRGKVVIRRLVGRVVADR